MKTIFIISGEDHSVVGSITTSKPIDGYELETVTIGDSLAYICIVQDRLTGLNLIADSN